MRHIYLLSPTLFSLAVFIVSDSEEVEVISGNEENLSPISSANPLDEASPTCTYHTPCTPSSGIMFWGSPTTDIVKVQTAGPKRRRRPLGEQNYYDTPPGEWSMWDVAFSCIFPTNMVAVDYVVISVVQI